VLAKKSEAGEGRGIPPFKNEGWGTRHRISAKHLPAYLDEMTWRFNNRKNPFLFRDTLLKLIASDNLECKELTKVA
jgi:hypothetical protein